MKTRILIPLFALAFALGACQKADDGKNKDKTNTAAKPVDDKGATPVAKPGASRPDEKKGHDCEGDCNKDCSGDCSDCKGAGEHDCGGHDDHGHGQAGAGTKLTHDVSVERTDEKGRKVTHVGKEFTKAELASVAEIISDPDKHKGKVVQVEGDISAMCHHKRGWMAVVADDKSGKYIRVMTAPTFLVPAESIGKTARVEGTIDTIEVPQGFASHMAKEHKLDEPAEKDGKLMQVVMRATAADFI